MDFEEILDFSNENDNIFIDGFRLERTSMACPEQYDVYDQNNCCVGYLRLRHGCFRADYPNCGDQTIYSSYTNGDGMFDGNEERLYHLSKAVEEIRKMIIVDKLAKLDTVNPVSPETIRNAIELANTTKA